MSYETANYLPKEVSVRQAAEFAILLGYRRSGTYAHLGSPSTISLIHFEPKDYRSWHAVELSISSSANGVVVGTRTRVGRSHYDFQFQNRTVREFRKRFGGKTLRDGGNGTGYDPGPPLPPPASGCYLAMQRLDWNLSRINQYLMGEPNKSLHDESLEKLSKIFPVVKELTSQTFSCNVLLPYLVAMMEDYLKSTYIAVLSYSERKPAIFKGSRLSGESLAKISNGHTTVEEAVAESMSFQNLAAVGKHFQEIDPKLDILAVLRKPHGRGKRTLLEKMEILVSQRHELIHGMNIDRSLDHAKVRVLVRDLTLAMSRIYLYLGDHFGWSYELPVSTNFLLRAPSRQRPFLAQKKAHADN